MYLTTSGCVQLKKFAYEGLFRDSWQQPEKVIQSLGLKDGDFVADLGSGSGYFTFRFASTIGSSGRVYAVDIDPNMNRYLRNVVRTSGFGNITVIDATPDDPLIPNPVDLIFTANTYHHFQNRETYFTQLSKYLKPNGKVAIMDFNGSHWTNKIIGAHNSSKEQIMKEMAAAGYTLISDFDFIKRQTFLIFAKEK